MNFRLLIVVVVLIWGGLSGGLSGFFACIAILAILGIFFPGSRRQAVRQERERQETQYEQVQPARRGSAVDPTRPTSEDIQAMQANNYTGRRK